MYNGLPEICYAMNNVTKGLTVLKRGESGYHLYKGYENEGIPTTQEEVDEKNEILEVTKGQRKAMEIGSMFGWDVPASNPNFYYEDGNVKR